MGLLWLFLWAALIWEVLGLLLITRMLLRPNRRSLGYALGRGLPAEPSELGWTFEESDFTLSDGSATVGWIIQGQSPQGPVFVVGHGWGECRYDVLPRLGPVIPLASWIIVYDLRGHGESRARLSHLGTCEEDDLRAILDQVIHRLTGPDSHAEVRFALLGYSMSAGVGISTAAKDTQNRIVLVVAEGPCRRLRDAVAGMLRSMRYPAQPLAWLTPWLASIWAPGVARIDRLMQARQLRCPLLVLHGSEDQVCDPQAARQMAEESPRGRWVQFAAGHLELARIDPALYQQALTEALRIQPPVPPQKETA